jgi:hypothetical protein
MEVTSCGIPGTKPYRGGRCWSGWRRVPQVRGWWPAAVLRHHKHRREAAVGHRSGRVSYVLARSGNARPLSVTRTRSSQTRAITSLPAWSSRR